MNLARPYVPMDETHHVDDGCNPPHASPGEASSTNNPHEHDYGFAAHTIDIGFVHVLDEPGGECVENCPHPDHQVHGFARYPDA